MRGEGNICREYEDAETAICPEDFFQLDGNSVCLVDDLEVGHAHAWDQFLGDDVFAVAVLYNGA